MPALVQITGILEDDLPRGRNVAADTRRKLVLVAGEDTTIRISLLHSDGTQVSLSSGSPSLAFTVRARPIDGEDKRISKDGVLAPTFGPNVFDVSIVPLDTKRLYQDSFIRGVWDCWLTQGGKRYQVVGTSPFRLLLPGTPPP